MSKADILVILACLAAGYWIVSVIMGSGSTTHPGPRSSGDEPGDHDPAAALGLPPPPTSPAGPRAGSSNDWQVVLDIPSGASRRDIQAAIKRRLQQAQDDGDTAMAERIRNAGEVALRQAR